MTQVSLLWNPVLRRSSSSFVRRFICTAVVLAIASAVSAGCQRKPLPEAGTPAADLYVRQCGGCHAAYSPVALGPKMWVAMVDRMEILMRRRGIQLSPAEKAEILAYLERNAGGR